MKSSNVCMLLSAFVVFSIMVMAYVMSYRTEDFCTLPTENTRLDCPTRNMSYDLRGDIPIPRKEWAFMNSQIGPKHPEACVRKGLILG